MRRKNAKRNALFTSIISLLLCVSMLVGTTFAWFTDSVESGKNTIAAGNLDVELLADGNKVDSTTKLFDLDKENMLWEPGMVVYENLQVANVGTLALKYQMTLNFGNENDLNGHKLSEVLKVAVVDKIAAGADRKVVLEAAKAAAAVDQGKGSLSNFYQVGTLEAGASSEEKAVVIFWDANDSETDNLYNVNNGQTTSDGQPLHIEFGVTLQATQQISEDDSFGNDYDEFSSILPKATVNNVSAEYPSVTATYGIGGAAEEIEMDFALQFLPNEKLTEAQSNAYRYWHADYVIKADKDVKANSMALAGYYKAWCQFNNDNWVALTADQDIAANTEIRLVEQLDATVNYEEICQYGNDGTGFLCGATDLTGENAGTTITVELRLYETTKAPDADGGPANEEVKDADGNPVYKVVGKYSYTFPRAVSNVDNQEDLEEALASGNDVNLAAGAYTFPTSSLKNGATLLCEDGTVFEGTSKLNVGGATVVGATFENPNGTAADQTINGTFKSCEFVGSNALRWCYAGETVVFENCIFSGDVYGIHFDGGANDVVFKNCTISGFNAMGGAITKATFEGCTFVANGKSDYNGINMWGDTDMINCTFVFDGTAGNEWIDLCSPEKTATFTNCVVETATGTADIADFVSKREDSATIIIDGETWVPTVTE